MKEEREFNDVSLLFYENNDLKTLIENRMLKDIWHNVKSGDYNFVDQISIDYHNLFGR